MVVSHSRVSLVVEIKYSRHIPASKGQAGALKPSAPWSDGQVKCPPPAKAQTSHSAGLLYLQQHPYPSCSPSASPIYDFPESQGIFSIEARLNIQEPPLSQVVRGTQRAVGQKGAGLLHKIHMASSTCAHGLQDQGQADAVDSSCPKVRGQSEPKPISVPIPCRKNLSLRSDHSWPGR